jgi:hypothetical protein
MDTGATNYRSRLVSGPVDILCYYDPGREIGSWTYGIGRGRGVKDDCQR